MMKSHELFLKKYFLQLSIIFILFIFFYDSIFARNTDFDFPIKLRLNNGKYLVMTTKGIYLFNEDFSSNIIKVKFNSRSSAPFPQRN